MLVAGDEFAHQPMDVPNWQENYVWHAWSPRSRCGWNLHLGNLAREGLIDVRAHVIVNGEVTAGSLQAPGAECLDVTGLSVDVRAPFERMRVRYEGVGTRGPDSGGWFGRGTGDVPFSLDVDVTTVHAPFDSNSHPELNGLMDLPGTGNHYELGGTWSGTLRSGDSVVESEGLVIRDHSWGGRAWKWQELFWVPMIFADAGQFVFNLTERFGEEWSSLSVTMGEDGVVRKAEELWVRLGGDRRPRQFSRADVLIRGSDYAERATLRGGIHLPVGRARSRVGLSDMYSTVESGGRTGFSTIQVFPSEEDVRAGFTNPLPQYR
jgi:hypothetical protein